LLGRDDALANDSRGVHGRRLELKSVDDGYEPTKSIEAVKKLLDEEKVFAMLRDALADDQRERLGREIETATAKAPARPHKRAPRKPGVVLFGEILPVEAFGRAEALAAGADLMLCIGSSLEVYPVAGLPETTLAGAGRIAILTQGHTPYDSRAAVRLGGDVVDELEAVLHAVRAALEN